MSMTAPSAGLNSNINITPFIDVLLVVLIFLMLSTTYSKYTELQLRLPVADAEHGVLAASAQPARLTRSHRLLQRVERLLQHVEIDCR